MNRDEIMAEVRAAFASAPRPKMFIRGTCRCGECLEHEEDMQSFSPDDPSVDKLCNPGWDPMWSYEEKVARAINEDRLNYQYLPDFQLGEAIQATIELSQAVDGCDLLLLATPAQFMRSVCEKLAPCLADTTVALISSKGIESETHALMSEVVSDTLPQCRIGILSGPSFAEEVAGGQPTAVTLAIEDQDLGRAIHQRNLVSSLRMFLGCSIYHIRSSGTL